MRLRRLCSYAKLNKLVPSIVTAVVVASAIVTPVAANAAGPKSSQKIIMADANTRSKLADAAKFLMQPKPKKANPAPGHESYREAVKKSLEKMAIRLKADHR